MAKQKQSQKAETKSKKVVSSIFWKGVTYLPGDPAPKDKDFPKSHIK